MWSSSLNILDLVYLLSFMFRWSLLCDCQIDRHHDMLYVTRCKLIGAILSGLAFFPNALLLVIRLYLLYLDSSPVDDSSERAES